MRGDAPDQYRERWRAELYIESPLSTARGTDPYTNLQFAITFPATCRVTSMKKSGNYRGLYVAVAASDCSWAFQSQWH